MSQSNSGKEVEPYVSGRRKCPETCEVVTAAANELLLDFDTRGENPYEVMGRVQKDLPWLLPCMSRTTYKWDMWGWISRHGGTHVIVSFDNNLTFEESRLLSLALGSDPKRELVRFRDRERDGTPLLYRPKGGTLLKLEDLNATPN